MAAATPTVTKPLFGKVIGTAVWIGGPPKDDWSDTTLTKPHTPMCIRGILPKSEIKQYSYQTKGPENKFKRNDPNYSLLSFADDCCRDLGTEREVFCQLNTKEIMILFIRNYFATRD